MRDTPVQRRTGLVTRLCLLVFAVGLAQPTAARTFAPTPTPTLPVCPPATPERLSVDPVFSPTDELVQSVRVSVGNGDRVEIVTESGRFVAEGDFSTAAATVAVTLLPGVTHHLEVIAHVRATTHDGCTFDGYTLRTTTDFHGAPLTITQGSDHGPTIAVDPTTLTLLSDGSFTITVSNAGPPGEALEISYLHFHHAYSQGDYGTGFTWDTSHLSLPLLLQPGDAVAFAITYTAGQLHGSRLVLQIVSNARNNYDTQYLAYFGRAAPTPTPTPDGSFGCDRELHSAPPHGPPGTIVELTGDCQPLHSGRSAPVYLDDEMIGWVSGETGGDYQNLVKIPPHATVGVHQLRVEGQSVRSTTTFAVTHARLCVGDCDGNATVAIDELITGVNITLQQQPARGVHWFDFDGDGTVTVDELIGAVAGSLAGCTGAPELNAFAGGYAVAVSRAEEFSPGAVNVEPGIVADSAVGALLIDFPYWPGVVRVSTSSAFDGSLALDGLFVRGDQSTSSVSGEATAVTDGEQRWIAGTVTFEPFADQRPEVVYFVMMRHNE